MIKRNYRTDEEWLALIQKCRASGLTDKQWCEEHGICPSNFYYQIRKFRKLACEVPERQTKSSLALQKQEVVQVTLEQPVQQEPQTYQDHIGVRQCVQRRACNPIGGNPVK